MSEARINPNGPLKGRNALVTGASRGIGEAIAARLAMEGANVVVSARTAESGESRLSGTLHETVDRIRRAGGQATFIKADLAQAAERERLIEQAGDHLCTGCPAPSEKDIAALDALECGHRAAWAAYSACLLRIYAVASWVSRLDLDKPSATLPLRQSSACSTRGDAPGRQNAP